MYRSSKGRRGIVDSSTRMEQLWSAPSLPKSSDQTPIIKTIGVFSCIIDLIDQVHQLPSMAEELAVCEPQEQLSTFSMLSYPEKPRGGVITNRTEA